MVFANECICSNVAVHNLMLSTQSMQHKHNQLSKVNISLNVFAFLNDCAVWVTYIGSIWNVQLDLIWFDWIVSEMIFVVLFKLKNEFSLEFTGAHGNTNRCQFGTFNTNNEYINDEISGESQHKSITTNSLCSTCISYNSPSDSTTTSAAYSNAASECPKCGAGWCECHNDCKYFSCN